MGFMTFLVLAVIVLNVIFAMIGGYIKGSRRAILRLIVVVAVAVLLIVFREKLTNMLFELKIKNQTIKQILYSKIPSDYHDYIDIIWPAAQVLFSLILFVVGLAVAIFVSQIINFILKLIIRPGKDKFGAYKYHRFIGMIVGVIQGLFISIIYCSILTGFSRNLAKLENVTLNEKPLFNVSDIVIAKTRVDLEEYNNNLGKKMGIFDKLIYDRVSKMDIDGKQYTLDGQVDSIATALEIANEFQSLSNSDFSADNKDDLIKVINKLDEIVGNMSPEAINMANDAIKALGEDLGIGDLSNFDISTVEFDKAAIAVESAFKIKDEELSSDELTAEIDKLVDNAIDSNILVQLAEVADMTIDVPTDVKEQIENKINSKDISAEDKAKLNALFQAE